MLDSIQVKRKGNTMNITAQQAELAKEIIRDYHKFISYHRHNLKGLSVEGTIEKYIKTFKEQL